MPHVLHLIKPPISPHALSMIRRQSGEPETRLTVVLLHGAETPVLPAGVGVKRLVADPSRPAEDALSYTELLDLLFSADQVISW